MMPLFVFLTLGLLQMGLTTQARVMAKYAAYRAARVGAMNNADQDAIQAAAIFYLLPVLATPGLTIMPTSSASEVITKFSMHTTINNTLATGEPMVKTVLCGPLKGDLDNSGPNAIGKAGQVAMGGEGSDDEVDFDDPALQSAPTSYISDAGGLRKFNRLRVVVQIQLMYRMPIPFANWVITKAYLGTQIPSVLMMPGKGVTERDRSYSQVDIVAREADMGSYVLPINVSYPMRMQSNLFLSRFPLPAKNECISYGHPGN